MPFFYAWFKYRHETGSAKLRPAKNASGRQGWRTCSRIAGNNSCHGCSTATLTAMEGGNAEGLYGTIPALRQTVVIQAPALHVLALR